jgi:hypothetical protein
VLLLELPRRRLALVAPHRHYRAQLRQQPEGKLPDTMKVRHTDTTHAGCMFNAAAKHNQSAAMQDTRRHVKPDTV